MPRVQCPTCNSVLDVPTIHAVIQCGACSVQFQVAQQPAANPPPPPPGGPQYSQEDAQMREAMRLSQLDAERSRRPAPPPTEIPSSRGGGGGGGQADFDEQMRLAMAISASAAAPAAPVPSNTGGQASSGNPAQSDASAASLALAKQLEQEEKDAQMARQLESGLAKAVKDGDKQVSGQMNYDTTAVNIFNNYISDSTVLQI